MVRIIRTEIAPQCLEDQIDYKWVDVIEKLEKDFHGKCYICETDQFSINVEHFIPHKGIPLLKFKWENLFFACNHCNNIKLATEILDCTNPNFDNDCIQFTPIFFIESDIKITTVKTDNVTKNTVDLLNKVYNGHTTIKTKDAEKLKKYLVEEMLTFQNLMLKYSKKKHNEYERDKIEKKISYELSKRSKLTAFKRQVIKDIAGYSNFKQFFD